MVCKHFCNGFRDPFFVKSLLDLLDSPDWSPGQLAGVPDFLKRIVVVPTEDVLISGFDSPGILNLGGLAPTVLVEISNP